MPDLTYRAERALLGAPIRDPGLLDDVAFLTADDFTAQAHRQIFTAITRAHAAQSDGTGPLSRVVVALAAAGPGIDAGYLEEMARTCPQPAHAPAYARMVAEARLRRQLAVHAERLFRDAGNLHYDIGRLSQAARAADVTT